MLELVKEASVRLRNIVTHTPLISSSSLSRLFGFDTYLKLENLQKTGSFKIRGAYNRISALSPEEKAKGVVAASLGNHAQGVASASAYLGVKPVIVMPETTAIVKFVATRGYGAEVVIHGKSLSEAFSYAAHLSSASGLTLIHPFDDDLVIAGQGTVGLEILAALPEADTIVVPVGGGGLIAGIASALKESGSRARVIGVESESCASCTESLKAGAPTEAPQSGPTIADGIAVKKVGERTFQLIKRYVDGVVSVSEETISEAILKLLERKKLVAEGAGAAPLAAAMEGKLPSSAKKCVFVISGGNIDVTMLDRVIRAGMLKEGRIMRLATVLPDEPGTLAGLASVIAGMRANILHIIHQRDAVDLPVRKTRIEVIMEIEGPGHAERVRAALAEKGYDI